MKKVLAMALMVLCCATAQASYLYWQVSDDSAAVFTTANYAKVMQNAGSGFTQIGIAEFNSSGSPMMSVESTVLTSDAGAFYIELYNYDAANNVWNCVGVSETATYASLVQAGAITSSLVTVPTPWTGGVYSVPEPTSGVLMVLGLALLGLRRRKV